MRLRRFGRKLSVEVLRIDEGAEVELTLEEVQLLKNGLFYLTHSARNVFDTDQVEELAQGLKWAERQIKEWKDKNRLWSNDEDTSEKQYDDE